MAEQRQKITIGVILAEADICKVTLHTKPATVDDLISNLQTALSLQFNISLQFEDPDFHNQLYNWTDIEGLQDKTTIKILPILELTPVQVPEDQSDASTRCNGWKNSLKFTLTSCQDVSVNAGKRGKRGEQPENKTIKKAKKGELNFLPNFPDGFQMDAIEDACNAIVDEMKKQAPDKHIVKRNMDLTLVLRRKEVVETEPVVMVML